MSDTASVPLTLSRRSGTAPSSANGASLRLALTAEERCRLRGHRRSLCGRDLVLQLERGEPLQPGEWLAGEGSDPAVQVVAAEEPLLRVRAPDPLALLQAAYHLGNRHVALEVRGDELRLLEDPVLADLLARRGLTVARCQAAFLPEAGAYPAAAGHGDHGGHHGHHGDHGHGHAAAHHHG